MDRPACLIVNPSAGGGRAARSLEAVQRALAELGVEHRSELTHSLAHARVLAEHAARAGELVLTLGGDGLVGCVAGVLRFNDQAVLGILPGGRGNDFARVLGIPGDPVAACAVLTTGEKVEVDVGDIDGQTFIGIVSGGFDSEANRIANDAPALLGNLVYAYGALRALMAWRPARFALELDGTSHSFSGYSVVAANSRAYGGGMFVAPDAMLDDGLLDVVISEHTSRWRFLAALPKVFKGEHVHEPTVHVLRARELRIAADRPFTLYADGEPIADLPAVVRAVPRTLRVLVPTGGSPAVAGSA